MKGSDASWNELADWWEGEVASDPTYREVVIPLVDEMLPKSGLFLDLGCGQGQVMAEIGTAHRTLLGCDLNAQLAAKAARHGSVVQAALPDLRWLRPDTVDGCLAVLVLEHVPDVESRFDAAAEITRPGGAFVVIANHPYVTAPGSASVVDPSDGEVFWRWGAYLVDGSTHEVAGSSTVEFHHRPLGHLLTAAARTGWDLRELREVETPESGDRLPDAGLPRLVAIAWERRN